jgi:hypothetical protein
VSLFTWGSEWIDWEGPPPVRLVDRESGEPIEPVLVDARTGERVDPRRTRADYDDDVSCLGRPTG